MTTTPPSPLPRRKWRIARWLAVLAFAATAYFGWKAYDARAAIKEAEVLAWGVNYTDPHDTIQKDWRATFKKETWQDAVPEVGIPTGEQLVEHRKLLFRLNPKALRVHDAPTLSDLTVLDGLTRLEALDLGLALSLASVDALKSHPALKELTLKSCPKLANLNALRYVPKLEKLLVHGATSLTNVDGLKNLSALEQLSLTDCPALTNLDGLKNLTALKMVAICDSPALTNVDALKTLPVVDEIWLVDCDSISQDTIKALKAALPKAQILTRMAIPQPPAQAP